VTQKRIELQGREAGGARKEKSPQVHDAGANRWQLAKHYTHGRPWVQEKEIFIFQRQKKPKQSVHFRIRPEGNELLLNQKGKGVNRISTILYDSAGTSMERGK